jgi:hypothetical protein
MTRCPYLYAYAYAASRSKCGHPVDLCKNLE